MKKINNSGQPGGMPINQDEMREVFNDEIWDAIESILSPYNTDTQGIIVSGCEVTGGGPYSIAAGVVYLNGEFMRLPAATGQTLPKYIAPATPVNHSAVFADTVIRVAFITKSAELVGSTPGAGQYVAITTSTDPDDRRLSNIVVNRQLATTFVSTLEAQGGIRTQNTGPFLKEYLLELSNWDMDTTGTVNRAHGLPDHEKIVSWTIIVYDDNGKPFGDTRAANIETWINDIDGTNVEVSRLAAGFYDSAAYNDTSVVRVAILFKVKP